jgi:hypothetical protein
MGTETRTTPAGVSASTSRRAASASARISLARGTSVFDREGTVGRQNPFVTVAIRRPEGSLAGAHVTMADSAARLVSALGLPVETALRMGITIPARVIGAPDLSRIEGRPLDEIVVLDREARFTGLLAELAAP